MINDLGYRIKHLRTARQWSLQQLGDAMGGTSKGYLYNLENGEVNPSISTVQKIADAFEMPVSELLGELGKGLTPDEYALVEAYRTGDTLGAIRLIMARHDA